MGKSITRKLYTAVRRRPSSDAGDHVRKQEPGGRENASQKLIRSLTLWGPLLVAGIISVLPRNLSAESAPSERPPPQALPGTINASDRSLTDVSLFQNLPSVSGPGWGPDPFLPASPEINSEATPLPPPPPPDPRAGLELTAVLTGGGQGRVVINGAIYTAGDSIGAGTVRRILPRGVILEFEGEEHFLALSPLTGAGTSRPGP